MSSGAVTCPQRIRADNRQEANRAREQTAERRKAVFEWTRGKLCSCGCGKAANCAHHPTDDLYGDQWADLSQCEPYNPNCHRMKHRGYERCPECGGWMARGSEKCSRCRGYSGLARQKSRHPCGRHRGQQRCQRDGRVFICSRSPKTAEGCDHLLEREAATS